MQVHSTMGQNTLIEELFLSVMGAIERLAWKHARCREEREDLISVAVVAIMEEIREGHLLERPGPAAYATVVAYHAIGDQHTRGYADILRRPVKKGELSPVSVMSLDIPLGDDEGDRCLSDFLVEEEPVSSSHRYDEALHAALSRRSAKQREAISRHYGFEGYGKQTSGEQARLLGVSLGAVEGRYMEALIRLRQDVQLCQAVGVEVPVMSIASTALQSDEEGEQA